MSSNSIKRFSSFFLVLIIMMACIFVPNNVALGQESTHLQFKNGKFNILVLSDYQESDQPYSESVALVAACLEKFTPDLIVLLGDNTTGWWRGVTVEKMKKAIDILVKPINDRKIPFAVVFGNHDEEGYVSKIDLMKMYMSYEYCIGEVGSNAVSGDSSNSTGVGDYNRLIKSSDGTKDVFNLYFMDSNNRAAEGGYGYPVANQIQWYEETSAALTAANGGKAIPALLFQHIIVRQVYDMFIESDSKTVGSVSRYGKYYTAGPLIDQGTLREAPCPPDENRVQFESWQKMGDIIGAFFGHDHTNDFSGVLDGIRLTAVPAVGFRNYGGTHGVRTITINEEDLSFTTDIHYFDEVVGRNPKNALIAKFGTIELNKYLTYIAIGVTVIGAIVLCVVLIAKKARSKKKSS